MRRFRLERGETLFLYSDGLTEARNARGEDFGFERLAGVVGALRRLDAEELLDGAVQHETAFRGTIPRQDDLTVMTVRRAA